MELYDLLNQTQRYISEQYSAALIDKSKGTELKAYIGKYLYDTRHTVDGYDRNSLIERLYCEMAEYSILTKYLKKPDVEEINSATRS